LTQKKAKLVHIGAIKRSKNQELVATDASKRSGRDKQKGKGKFNESKKERPIQSLESSSSHKGKKKKERTLCIYFSKGFHPKENCMRKTINEMESNCNNTISLCLRMERRRMIIEWEMGEGEYEMTML